MNPNLRELVKRIREAIEKRDFLQVVRLVSEGLARAADLWSLVVGGGEGPTTAAASYPAGFEAEVSQLEAAMTTARTEAAHVATADNRAIDLNAVFEAVLSLINLFRQLKR